jgi:hypothetical protein
MLTLDELTAGLFNDSVVLEPTTLCNLNCSYCYLPPATAIYPRKTCHPNLRPLWVRRADFRPHGDQNPHIAGSLAEPSRQRSG